MIYIFSLCAFLWGVIGTPIAISLARKFRLLDTPGGRKIHTTITPRGAGIVIWSGYLVWTLFMGNQGVEMPYIATGASLVFIVGYMDDMHPLPPLVRLVFHLIAAAWVTYALPLPLWQRALIVVWTAGVTNAYNLIDGMDGLCMTMTLITSLAAYSAVGSAAWVPFAALVFGVFLWNFPKAHTFLGDGGSTVLGYICAAEIAWSIFPNLTGVNIIKLAFILLFLGGVPVIDTLVAMTRRIIHKKSPFLPDKGHAHHRLLALGCSKLVTLLIMGCAHAAFIGIGMKMIGLSVINMFN